MDTTIANEPTSGALPLYCPTCGAELVTELLILEEEEEEAGQEALLLLDCLTGDFHLAVTEKDILEVAATEVMMRLRLKGRAP